jgi:hypothetical protein
VFSADELEIIVKFIQIERELLGRHTKRLAGMVMEA